MKGKIRIEVFCWLLVGMGTTLLLTSLWFLLFLMKCMLIVLVFIARRCFFLIFLLKIENRIMLPVNRADLQAYVNGIPLFLFTKQQ